MAKSAHSTFCYRIITWALFPLALTHTIYTGLKHRKPVYILQRLGHYRKKKLTHSPIWCHCASVGEINTALPLLNSLIHQGESLLISTNTITGYDTLVRAKLKNSLHIYLPLDYKIFAKRLINQFQPKLCLLFETELWPNILLTASQNNITVAIMNGRISDKTLNAPKFLLKNYQIILSNVERIVSSSEENTQRFISIGANPEVITTLDNLKFASLGASKPVLYEKPLEHPYLLCASTHEGEEQRIVNAWKNQPHPQLGLVIALRHPQRINEVVHILDELKLAYYLHSSKTKSPGIEAVYIIDTLGELMPFIAHAQVVFMGGSLVPIGGHNVIEPAQYKRCILIGPHYDNFKNIVTDLQSRKAIEIVQDAQQLINKAHTLSTDDANRIQMGERAYHYIKSKKQILNNYEEITQQILTRR